MVRRDREVMRAVSWPSTRSRSSGCMGNLRLVSGRLGDVGGDVAVAVAGMALPIRALRIRCCRPGGCRRPLPMVFRNSRPNLCVPNVLPRPERRGSGPYRENPLVEGQRASQTACRKRV
jgi:hypothetical protein